MRSFSLLGLAFVLAAITPEGRTLRSRVGYDRGTRKPLARLVRNRPSVACVSPGRENRAQVTTPPRAFIGQQQIQGLLAEMQAQFAEAAPNLREIGRIRDQVMLRRKMRQPELLVDLGGASLTVHYFDGNGNPQTVVKSKSMLANASCAECKGLKEEGLEKGWIKERTPPDYAELGYTFADYSDASAHSWPEVSSYLSRVIRIACRRISEIHPTAATARLTVLQTGKIRQYGGVEWERLMRQELQKAFGSATFVDFPHPPQHALLSATDEAYFEGLMMFKYHDLSMINITQPANGPILERDNAIALSIGSSSTQMYTLDNRDRSLITRTNTRLGVYPPDFPANSLQFKTGAQVAEELTFMFNDGGAATNKKFLLLVNAIGYVMKEVPGLSYRINRQEPIPKSVFCRESRRWLESMRSVKYNRWDLDMELYHQLQLLSGLVNALERQEGIEFIIVEKKGHLKPNGLRMMGTYSHRSTDKTSLSPPRF